MARKKQENSAEKYRVYDGMRHLILCEGMDAWRFLSAYLNSAAVSEYQELSTIYQVENFGGNEELTQKLELWLRAPGFEQLESLTVVRDAETDAATAQAQVVHAFQNAGLSVSSQPHTIQRGGGIKTGFLLFPTCDSNPTNGTLEDLCISIFHRPGGKENRRLRFETTYPKSRYFLGFSAP